MTAPALTAPAPRPGQGLSSARAQRWVLAAAIVVGLTYALRRFVEPGMSIPPRGGRNARLAGTGSPPPALPQWAVAYGAGFMILGLVALPAPEVAAALSVLVVTGTLLGNGLALADDLRELQGTPSLDSPQTAKAMQDRADAAVDAGRLPLSGLQGYGTDGLGGR